MALIKSKTYKGPDRRMTSRACELIFKIWRENRLLDWRSRKIQVVVKAVQRASYKAGYNRAREPSESDGFELHPEKLKK